MTARAFRHASPMSAVEQRLCLVPLEELLAERDELVTEVAPLRARYGPFGTFEALRKIELAKLAIILRAKALEAGKRPTNDEVDDQCHSDERYQDFVIAATQQKAKWIILENRIEGIQNVIMRGQAVARFLAAEAHL